MNQFMFAVGTAVAVICYVLTIYLLSNHITRLDKRICDLEKGTTKLENQK